MMKKAKTYLASIQAAATERELTGIELMFKQDMSINCDDLGKLCRAAEDKRYTLRNNAETLQLKDILFQRDESRDGCLPRHEPQAGELDGRGHRTPAHPILRGLAGHRGGRAGR